MTYKYKNLFFKDFYLSIRKIYYIFVKINSYSNSNIGDGKNYH